MHLLFDLDGTLVDSFPGISRSINQTLTTIGRDPVPVVELRQFVGLRDRTDDQTLAVVRIVKR